MAWLSRFAEVPSGRICLVSFCEHKSLANEREESRRCRSSLFDTA
jgi:hypothetical protein